MSGPSSATEGPPGQAPGRPSWAAALAGCGGKAARELRCVRGTGGSCPPISGDVERVQGRASSRRRFGAFPARTPILGSSGATVDHVAQAGSGAAPKTAPAPGLAGGPPRCKKMDQIRHRPSDAAHLEPRPGPQRRPLSPTPSGSRPSPISPSTTSIPTRRKAVVNMDRVTFDSSASTPHYKMPAMTKGRHSEHAWRGGLRRRQGPPSPPRSPLATAWGGNGHGFVVRTFEQSLMNADTRASPRTTPDDVGEKESGRKKRGGSRIRYARAPVSIAHPDGLLRRPKGFSARRATDYIKRVGPGAGVRRPTVPWRTI